MIASICLAFALFGTLVEINNLIQVAKYKAETPYRTEIFTALCWSLFYYFNSWYGK